MADYKIEENKELSIWEALTPVVLLIGMLAYNIFFEGGELWGEYSNHYILLVGAVIAGGVGFFNQISLTQMFDKIKDNLSKTLVPIVILLLVGALAGTWLVSGIIPTMIYYGLQILSPSIFLPATVVIAAIISLATGSSWTTSATVGIALIGIGQAIGMPSGMIAGAVISGAYFGDKMSPLSDTTNLAPAMAGTDLFTHIRYMSLTTVPSIIITIIIFSFLSFTVDTGGATDISDILASLKQTFNITPLLFIVPLLVIGLILLKTKPIIALLSGVLAAAVFALIFQPEIIATLGGGTALDLSSGFKGLSNAIFVDTTIASDNETLQDLFSSGGVWGMKWTIMLIISAMVFGGVMEAIGGLARISKALLQLSDSVFGLFSSTVASCLALNITASDQYLAIVIPGKMFAQAYEDKGLAPENLSRTLEDSGTVTSVLIPWNTCGAYQADVLGVSVAEYFFYAIFNYLSPIMTLVFALFSIKIKQLVKV
ncbi:MAG: Na+/H+ antiporter NhaC family protein [Saprospiraceae bacterium]